MTRIVVNHPGSEKLAAMFEGANEAKPPPPPLELPYPIPPECTGWLAWTEWDATILGVEREMIFSSALLVYLITVRVVLGQSRVKRLKGKMLGEGRGRGFLALLLLLIDCWRG